MEKREEQTMMALSRSITRWEEKESPAKSKMVDFGQRQERLDRTREWSRYGTDLAPMCA